MDQGSAQGSVLLPKGLTSFNKKIVEFIKKVNQYRQ
jgi:hypothetical protein